jgi:hypothetical protein
VILFFKIKMKFTLKEYSIVKTQTYIKNETLFFIFNGVNRQSDDWIIVEQKFKNFDFFCYKILNKTTKKTIQHSIYKNMSTVVNSITFLLKTNIITTIKQNLFYDFESITFTFLTLKLNNRFYSKEQLEYNFSFNYGNSTLTFFQFGLVNGKYKKL